MTRGVPHTTLEEVELAKEMKVKYSQLFYIEHKDYLLQYGKEWYHNNRVKARKNGREWHARNQSLKMNGLCHLCFCTNIELFNHKGQIICNSCLQDYIRDNPETVYIKY